MGRIKDILIDFTDLAFIKIDKELVSEEEITNIALEVANAWLNTEQSDYTDLIKMNNFITIYLEDNYLSLMA